MQEQIPTLVLIIPAAMISAKHLTRISLLKELDRIDLNSNTAAWDYPVNFLGLGLKM